jgi:hypothetical protein
MIYDVVTTYKSISLSTERDEPGNCSCFVERTGLDRVRGHDCRRDLSAE